jgi:phage repressor protein C with HTH and peptisase S24 domain
MMRIHDKIRSVIENTKGLTQKGLAAKMGLNPAAINRMLYGDRNIKAEEIPIIEDYLGIKLDLVNPDGKKPAKKQGFSDGAPTPLDPPTLVPVYGYAAGSDHADAKSGGLNLANGEVIDWVPRHPGQIGIKDAFAIYVFSDSMEPRYYRGELVYIHTGRPPEAGKDCIIEMMNGDAYIKRLVKVGGGKIKVLQYNPEQEKEFIIKDIKAIYMVVGRG